MLKVTVSNCDRSFVWVFDSADKAECAQKALNDLVANHDFFDDNRICIEFPAELAPVEGAVGILLMPDETFDEALGNGNAYWIAAEEYELGSMVWSEG